MSTRYLINGEMNGWFVFGRIAGPVAVVAGIGLLLSGERDVQEVAYFISAVGVILTISMEIAAFRKLRKRMWIELQPAGFSVTDRNGTREWQDHEIVSLAYLQKPLFSNGSPAGFSRFCRLWPAKSTPIEMQNAYKEGAKDPVHELIVRLTNLLQDGFAQALDHGVEVSGDGWQLNKSHLRCRVKGREEALPLSEISAVQAFEGKMAVWVRGKDEPVAQFAVDGRNAWLLPDLIAPYLTKSTKDEPPEIGLGRILFSRRASFGARLGLLVAALVFLVLGIVITAAGVPLTTFLPIVLFFIGIGAFFAFFAWRVACSKFSCHEWGVDQRGIFGASQLSYRDVASFSYSATRNYYNGTYTGTSLKLVFKPHPGRGGKITFDATMHNADADLETLRGFVSQIIAAQMHTRLAAGEPVPWTNNLTFRTDGIAYRPGGFLGRKEPVFLPFTSYHGYNLDQGVFYLFEKGKPKAVLTEAVSEANFFPGFHLLHLLLHSQAAAAETDAPAEV